MFEFREFGSSLKPYLCHLLIFISSQKFPNSAADQDNRCLTEIKKSKYSLQVRCVTGRKIVFRTLGFILSTLGSVPSNVFTVVLGTLNTFDGTDPTVWNMIFFSPVCISMCPSPHASLLTM